MKFSSIPRVLKKELLFIDNWRDKRLILRIIYLLQKKNIVDALKKSNRENEKVEIIGVSKNVDVDRVNEAISLGIENIGENRVQELLKKVR